MIHITFFLTAKSISSGSILSTHQLKSKAEDLREEFHSLHLAIRKSSIQMDFEEFKFHVQDLLTDDLKYPQSVTYLAEVKKLTTSSDILLFLKIHGFVGYQNYELLAHMVRCLWKEDQKIVAKMEDYIKKYKEFEQELSLSQLEKITHEEDLRPTVPSGLPEFSLKINGDTNARQWRDYLGKFPWSIYIFIKSLIPGSIIITYVALPCIVSDVLRDLTDPVILRELESIGVTVVLLPQPSQTSEVLVFTVKSILYYVISLYSYHYQVL